MGFGGVQDGVGEVRWKRANESWLEGCFEKLCHRIFFAEFTVHDQTSW